MVTARGALLLLCAAGVRATLPPVAVSVTVDATSSSDIVPFTHKWKRKLNQFVAL